jgi:hypothetical protein
MPHVLLCWVVGYAFLYHYIHSYTILGEVITDIKVAGLNLTECPGGKMKAVGETSRVKWWEWFVVGVLFATAVVCAHIA